jgi:squalene-associated FAD-dependent desaturase
VSDPQKRIVVVGAGLAGLTAALDCADAGAQVTLLERRGRLGGLTWSFTHGDHSIDNGQHVFLRCCTAYRGFLERIGSAGDVALQDRLDVRVLDPGAPGLGSAGALGPLRSVGAPGAVPPAPKVARLRRNGLPAPLHLGPALLRYGHLSVAERLRLGRAALPLRRVALDDPKLDQVTFAQWLAARGQSPRATRALWDIITLATVNLPAAEASAAMGAKVFQTGLLTDPAAADIGWSRIPLGRLHGERAATALAATGAKVITDCRVGAVRAKDDGFRVSVEGGEDLPADAVIVAVPHTVLPAILAPGISPGVDPSAMGTSPIVNVHVVYDRPVTDWPFAASVRGPLQWVFDRTVSSGLEPEAGPGNQPEPGRRQYLAVTISAADSFLGRSPAEVVDTSTEALRRLFPAARTAQVLDALVTKERTATFRAVPGTAAQRPGPLTNVPGVVVAGAWTDTGWPATMEGAVRSGHAAARAALVAAGTTRRLPEEVA